MCHSMYLHVHPWTQSENNLEGGNGLGTRNECVTFLDRTDNGIVFAELSHYIILPTMATIWQLPLPTLE
jgi:hypothetical protein